MNPNRRSRIVSRVSFAVRLIDAHTGGHPIDPTLRVELEGLVNKPVRKDRGLYVYVDLPVKTVAVHIRSMYYFDEDFVADPDTLPENGIYTIQLLPTPAYPSKPGMTWLLGKTTDKRGEPLADVRLSLTALHAENVKAKVLGAEGKKGAKELTLMVMSGTLQPGDRLVYRVKQDDSVLEHITIAQVPENGSGVYRIEQPLAHALAKGTALFPSTGSRSNAQGDFAMALRYAGAPSYRAILRLDHGGKITEKEVEISEGTIHRLGTIPVERK